MGSLPPGVDPSLIPLAKNPDGSPPNFVDPPSLKGVVLAVGITFTVITGIILILRLFTNFKLQRKLGLGDYLCLFGWMGGVGYWGIINSLAQDGASRHTWDIPSTIVTESFIKKQFSNQMVIAPTMWAAKASILTLYLGMFNRIRWLRLTCYGMLVFLFLLYGTNIAIAGVYCVPRSGHAWDARALERCSSHGQVVSAVVIGVLSVAADLVLFAMPLPVIWKLNLNRRKKIGLSLVFLVGFLTVVTSVASLAYRVKVYQGNDPIWNGINVATAMFIEVFGTVIVSCAPALSAFWLQIFSQSRVYSILRSRIGLPRSTTTTGDLSNSGQGSGSTSHLKHNKDHYSMFDDDKSDQSQSRGFHTRIYSTEGPTPIPMREGITKHSYIDQSSRRV